MKRLVTYAYGNSRIRNPPTLYIYIYTYEQCFIRVYVKPSGARVTAFMYQCLFTTSHIPDTLIDNSNVELAPERLNIAFI